MIQACQIIALAEPAQTQQLRPAKHLILPVRDFAAEERATNMLANVKQQI